MQYTSRTSFQMRSCVDRGITTELHCIQMKGFYMACFSAQVTRSGDCKAETLKYPWYLRWINHSNLSAERCDNVWRNHYEWKIKEHPYSQPPPASNALGLNTLWRQTTDRELLPYTWKNGENGWNMGRNLMIIPRRWMSAHK